MKEIEAKLRECTLAAVPDHVERRILSRTKGRRRSKAGRRFWMGIAASILLVWLVNHWTEGAYDLSPYGSAVESRAIPKSAVPAEYEAELAGLLGDAARGYVAYLRGETNGG